jgi:hypothetical protein
MWFWLRIKTPYSEFRTKDNENSYYCFTDPGGVFSGRAPACLNPGCLAARGNVKSTFLHWGKKLPVFS